MAIAKLAGSEFEEVSASELKMGEYAVVVEDGSNKGEIVLMSYREVIISLKNGHTWSKPCTLQVRKLSPGEVVTITI